MAEFPADTAAWRDAELEARWHRLLEVRSAVNVALEGARQRKEIGNALSAHVTLVASGEQADLLERHAADLPMFFITSTAAVRRTAGAALDVEVKRAAGDKCPRCWRFVTDIVSSGDLAGLCARCADVVGDTVVSGR